MDLEISDKPSTGNKRNFSYSRVPGPPKVCKFWKEGKCTRSPCDFLHSTEPEAHMRTGMSNGFLHKRAHQISDERDIQTTGSSSRRIVSAKWGRGRGGRVATLERDKVQDKVCNYWLAGTCKFAEGCKFLHSHVMGSDVSLLTQLVGHHKAIRGITFPANTGKLFSGGLDKKVIAWDCQTGEGKDVQLEGEVGSILSEGPWLFVGIPNLVKAWNTLTSLDISLDGPRGQVHALAIGNEMLLAGTQDGSILAWRFSSEVNSFQPAASLSGHSLAVVTMTVKGADRLYSGSMDNTIRVWDLGTFQCMQVLSDHASVVMSLLLWNQFLLSCSLDNTVKVWVVAPSGVLEVTYTHNEEHGVLALCGMNDEQDKPVLLCSCNDNTVRLYDLPSFNERGRIFSRNEVRAVQIGPGGLFFTGDGMGELKVWKWTAQKQ